MSEVEPGPHGCYCCVFVCEGSFFSLLFLVLIFGFVGMDGMVEGSGGKGKEMAG